MLGKKVGIVGAGMMGAEIALQFAIHGYDVIVSDATPELAEQGRTRMVSALDRQIKRKAVEADQKDATMARVKATHKLADFADRDLIVEAIIEKVEIKHKVFSELDKICQPNCIFASNTSSISITTLSSAVSPERAKRFLGLHYFSPATIMKLVEVIPGFVCEDAIVETCMEYMKSTNKVPVKVKDVTGFVVNRILVCYAIEALRLLDEGVASVEDIDIACKLGLNHPIGPFELMDLTSVDLAQFVHGILFEEYGERFRTSSIIKKMVSSNRLGKKVGRGFYEYNKK